MSDPAQESQEAHPSQQMSAQQSAALSSNQPMQLRNRDQLQATQLYRTTNESAQLQQIEKIKKIRSGKKRSITLRLTQIKRVLDERGSRTKVTYLRDKLQEAFEDLLQVNDNLMQLLEPNDKDFGNEYVEEIGVQVDEYISDVESYLVERKDDPPSTSPSTCSDVNSDAGSS